MTDMISIRTSDEKYGVMQGPSGAPYATRHGMLWRMLDDAPHILTLAKDLQQARDALSAAGEDPLAQGEPPAHYGEEKDLLVVELSDGSRLRQSHEGRSMIETPDGAMLDLTGDNLALGLAYEIEGARCRIAELAAEAAIPMP